jgi:hypothetical protein
VLDDFGERGRWRKADEQRTDRETVNAQGQFPSRVQ